MWTVRRDRGLSATESIDYELWLAADPRHQRAMAQSETSWDRLDRIPDDFAHRILQDGRRRRRWWRVAGIAATLPAAAAIAVVFFHRAPRQARDSLVLPGGSWVQVEAPARRLVALADGSEVRLNAGAEIVEQFSATERRVELIRGEAHFTVVKDPARPFIVLAGGLFVRAVGTVFNVNRRDDRTEVLVTEGRVALRAPSAGETPPMDVQPGNTADRRIGDLVELAAGEQAVVTIPSATPTVVAPNIEIARMDPQEIARVLAWKENLVRLGGATLAEIAAEFERRTGHRVVVQDPVLRGIRVGGRFRADDPEGFAKLLSSMLDVEAERSPDGAIVLKKKK